MNIKDHLEDWRCLLQPTMSKKRETSAIHIDLLPTGIIQIEPHVVYSDRVEKSFETLERIRIERNITFPTNICINNVLNI